MWNELNRILGGQRNDGQPIGEQAPVPEAPLPENAAAGPAEATLLEANTDPPTIADNRSGTVENPPAGEFVDDRDWDALVPPPAEDEREFQAPDFESAAEATAPPPRSRRVVL